MHEPRKVLRLEEPPQAPPAGEALRLLGPPGGEILYHAARDGARLRTALWRAPEAKANVVILPGRTEFIEKYFEVTAELIEKGFNVAAVDWRGQGLSARPLANPLKGHIDSFRTYIDDFRDIVADVIRPRMKGPLFLLCHSMGGNIGARILIDEPLLAAAAIFTGPMFGINPGRVPLWAVRTLTNIAAVTGLDERYIPGEKDRTVLAESFAENVVTTDEARFLRNQGYVAAVPELALGPPTYGWLKAGLNSIDNLARPGVAEAIPVPALFVVAGQEMVVDNPAIHAFARRMRKSIVLELAQARHEILMERDEIRREFWAAFDAFVAEILAGA